jgi:hypothetical protein
MPANHIERPHRGQFGAWMDDADCGLDFDRRITISRVQAGAQLSLPATDAWDRAAAGDENRLFLEVGLGNPPRTKWWASELRPPFTHFTCFDAR